MKAIPLPYTKYKLRELSRELYLEHGWQMPRGFLDSRERDPKSFTHAQWQQAKRNGKDPRAIKAALQDSWAISDSQKGFQQALKDRGFTLAKGDRRGFVALDHACQVYAVPKWTGVRAKDVRVRLKDQEALPSVSEARAQIAKDMTNHLSELLEHQNKAVSHRLSQIAEKRSCLIEKQLAERERLKAEQERRQSEETKQRQARFTKGMRGFFDRMLGRHKKLKQQNEHEARQTQQRDQKERDTMVFKQLEARRVLQARTHRLEKFREERQQALSQDIEQYNEIGKNKRELFELRQRNKNRSQDRGPELEL